MQRMEREMREEERVNKKLSFHTLHTDMEKECKNIYQLKIRKFNNEKFT